MSDRIVFRLTPDLRARIAATLPGVTAADFDWLGRIIAADGFVQDDGTPHPSFVAWVQAILDRRGGAEGVAAVVPVKPVPGAAGAMIGGVV